MNQIETFVRRLKRIGIEVEFIGNYPWIYLDKVNGRKVTGTYLGNHGFTAFWLPIRAGDQVKITSIPVVFKKIKDMLHSEPEEGRPATGTVRTGVLLGESTGRS